MDQRAGEGGNDVDGDDDGGAVTDTFLGHLITDPHQQNRAGHDGGHSESHPQGRWIGNKHSKALDTRHIWNAARTRQRLGDKEPLHDGDADGDVAGVLGDFLTSAVFAGEA